MSKSHRQCLNKFNQFFQYVSEQKDNNLESLLKDFQYKKRVDTEKMKNNHKREESK